MSIANVHIYYPSILNLDSTLTAQLVSWYDLRDVTGAINVTGQPTLWGTTAAVIPRVRGIPSDGGIQYWPKTEFEAAKLASLASGG
jgi:hypothetical protein